MGMRPGTWFLRNSLLLLYIMHEETYKSVHYYPWTIMSLWMAC